VTLPTFSRLVFVEGKL